MVRIESNCSNCYDSDSYCVGYCQHKSFPVLVCDNCNEITDELYSTGSEQLCMTCFLNEHRLTDEELGI